MEKYIEAVERHLSDLEFTSPGLCPGCTECMSAFGYESEESFEEDISSGKIFDEGSFSWHSCQSCGSSVGGERFAAHGVNENGEIIHFDVCQDCLFYLANGDLPETWEE